MSESSDLTTQRNIHLEARSKLMYLQLETKLMHPLFPKVKDSRALSRDMASTEDLWLMVPNSTVIRVPMVHAPHRAVYSKEKECLDIWAA